MMHVRLKGQSTINRRKWCSDPLSMQAFSQNRYDQEAESIHKS